MVFQTLLGRTPPNRYPDYAVLNRTRHIFVGYGLQKKLNG